MFYGLIADGIHTHPTATRIAHRSHPGGMWIFSIVIYVGLIKNWLPAELGLLFKKGMLVGSSRGVNYRFSHVQDRTQKKKNPLLCLFLVTFSGAGYPRADETYNLVLERWYYGICKKYWQKLLNFSGSEHFVHFFKPTASCFSLQTGLVLVTDAIAALGLPPGLHKLGPMQVEIDHEKAMLQGTNTLAGR